LQFLTQLSQRKKRYKTFENRELPLKKNKVANSW